VKPASIVLLLALAAVESACMMPSATPYRAATTAEQALLARSRRDFLPADAKRDPDATKALVAWTGILREVDETEGETTFLVDHRYWDWVVDLGTQKVKIFLSPRGEGVFRFSVGGTEGRWLAEHATVGEMLIVYGVPLRDDSRNEATVLRYVHARGFPKDLYSTEVWDYDREFAVEGRGAPAQIDLDAF
jgi:hypothetical protein